MTEIRLPKLGDAVHEGTIGEFYVEDGAHVAEGDLIYRVETDKVETDIYAPVSGTLRIEAFVGEPYPVGTLVATIA